MSVPPTTTEMEESISDNMEALRPALPTLQAKVVDIVALCKSSLPLRSIHVAVKARAESIAGIVGQVSACRIGCSHCCKMAVGISSIEAGFLGEAIGVVPHTVEGYGESIVEKYINTVCPFLKNNQCVIYAHRPLVCRTHFNVSAYPEQCDTINNPGRDVPNINFTEVWNHYGVLDLMHGAVLADIRDFFPYGLDEVASL